MVTTAVLLHLTLITSINAAPLLSTSTMALRDATNRTLKFDPSKFHIGTVELPSIRKSLSDMLGKQGPDFLNDFITASPIHLTSFGLDDDATSNADLSSFVDHAFNSDGETRSNAGWVDTYIEFLIEAGQKCLPDLKTQFKVIDEYFDATDALAAAQAKLLQAYRNATDAVPTNIGAHVADAQAVDTLTIVEVEKWFNGTDGHASNFSMADFENYEKAKQAQLKLKPEFDALDQANKVAAKGWLYKGMVDSYPGVFNVSMLVGGDPSSPQAKFSPAWSATIIQASRFDDQDAKDLQDNINDGLSNSTFTNTEFATPTHTSTSSQIHSSSAHSTPAPSPSPSASKTKKSIRMNAVNVVALRAAANEIQPNSAVSASDVSKTLSSPSASASADNELKNVPDTALQGNLMLLSLNEGAWAAERDTFIAWARQNRPSIFAKYFGNDTHWTGPIAKRSTHLAIVTINKVNSTDLGNVNYLGQVASVLPILLSGNSTVNATASAANSTFSKEECPDWN